MTAKRGNNWVGVPGKEASPALLEKVATARKNAMATVTIVIYGPASGQSEVSIATSSEGSFGAFQRTTDARSSKAASDIYGVATRELKNALTELAGG